MYHMMPSFSSRAAALICVLSLIAPVVANAQVAPGKQPVDGVTNFTRLDATVACAGATKAAAVPELRQMGFASIVNLRRPSEEGADVEGERAAAEAAGLKYFQLPFSVPKTPDENVDATVQEFLAAVGNPANQPVFIHCAGGGRAAGFWLIKRVLLDGWDVDRARAEADIVYSDPESPALNWAEQYAKTHRK